MFKDNCNNPFDKGSICKTGVPLSFLGKLFATISLMMNLPSGSHFDMVSIITLLTSALKFFPYVTTSKSSISMLLIILFSAEFATASYFSTPLFEQYFCQNHKPVGESGQEVILFFYKSYSVLIPAVSTCLNSG